MRTITPIVLMLRFRFELFDDSGLNFSLNLAVLNEGRSIALVDSCGFERVYLVCIVAFQRL